MFVKQLTINHLKEVARLEQSVYPEELCLGYEDYLEDFRNTSVSNNYSFGVFQNGELKAYVICYKIRSNHYYISDFVCTSPAYLMPLLLAFGVAVEGHVLSAEFRYTSYRLLRKFARKYPSLVELLSVEKEENYYYNGENVHRVKFRIKMKNLKNIPDPKLWIMKEIYWGDDFQVHVKNVIYKLLFYYKMTEEEIMSYKSFIMRHVHNRNLDALRMTGDTFKFYVYHYCLFKDPKGYETMKKYLLSKGYKPANAVDDEEPTAWSCGLNLPAEKELKLYDDTMYYSDRKQYLEWYCLGELDNTKFREDTISYYRSHIKRKFINYYKEKKFVEAVTILDRYGDKWLCVRPSDHVYNLIPRNYRNLFDAYLKNLAFLKEIRTEAMKHYSEYDVEFLVNKHGILALRKYAGEDVARNYFDRVMEMAKNSNNPRQILHDWGYIIPEILHFEEYLTRGAIRHLFTQKSLNQMNKIKDALSGLNIENTKYLDKKVLRKEISKAIRKDEDISPIVAKAVREAEAKWLKSKRISKSMQENMLTFIERMKRYAPHISLNHLFRCFGNHAVAMVKGTYEGLFKEKTIYPDYSEFGEFLLGVLDKRTRRNKRLYGALNKIQNINEIFAGQIRQENWIPILKELRQRHIKVPEQFSILNRFYAKVEKKCSPEFLVAGNASVCCMSFGQGNAISYALQKGFGIINIYYKDRIIANSVIWINQPYNCLVLDNIEVHPNYTKFNQITQKLFEKTVLYLLQEYNLEFAVQGRNYNDLELYSVNDYIRFEILKPEMVDLESFDINVEPVGGDIFIQEFYSDAHYVYPLTIGCTMTAEEIFARIKKINQKVKEKRDKDFQRMLEHTTDELALTF